MKPGPHASCHVQAGRRAEGQDFSGTLFGYSGFQQLLIDIVSLTEQFTNLPVKEFSSTGVKIINAVLSVLKVLPAEFR
jgi:hypothetical protein